MKAEETSEVLREKVRREQESVRKEESRRGTDRRTEVRLKKARMPS